MGPRLNLDATLRSICPNVYFQPPESTKLKYPCIIYNLDNFDQVHADNLNYLLRAKYTVTYITRNSDDPAKVDLAEIPYCALTRSFVTDNLYHHVYSLYY